MLFYVIDVNECENSPCQNSGTCINTEGSYGCNCTEGWQGHNCEIGNTSFKEFHFYKLF